MADLNEELLDALIRRQVYLGRYASGLGSEMVRLLDLSERDLERTLRKRLDAIERAGGRDGGPVVTRRLVQLRQEIGELRAKAYATIRTKLTSEMGALAFIEADKVKEIIDGLSVIDLKIGLPNARALANTVGALFQGDGLKQWIGRAAEADFRRISDAVGVGFTLGETVDQIAARIIGTQGQDYADGVLEISRKGARTLARTATNHVANAARQEVYKANEAIIPQELFVATLDSRTSPICRALDGKLFKVGAGPVPPVHWNCRSTRVPYIVPFDEEAIRSGQFGAVPADTTYDTWLKRQSNGFQDEVLGPERARLFRDGGLTMDKFVDLGTKREFTLDELRRREPDAWNRAFGRETGDRTEPARPPARPPEPAPPPPPVVKPEFFKAKLEAERLSLERAFAEADDKLKEILDKTRPLSALNMSGKDEAYYMSVGHSVTMSKKYKPGKYNAVFRHEMGHALDYENAWYDPKTNAYQILSFKAANEIGEDASALRRGVKNALEPAQLAAIQRETDKLLDLPLAERLDALRKIEKAEKFVLTVDDAQALGIDLSLGNSIDKLLRWNRSINAGDWKNMMDSLYFSIPEELDEAKALALNLADYLGAATKNAVGWGHSNAYYDRTPSVMAGLTRSQVTEVFANHVSFIGAPPKLRDIFTRLVKAAVPRTYLRMEQIIASL